MKARRIAGFIAVGFAGFGLAAATSSGSPDRPWTSTPVPTVPGQLGPGCPSGNTYLLMNFPSFIVDAGTGARVIGCGWFPDTGCKEPVVVTMKVNGNQYTLEGNVEPKESAFAFPVPNTSSKIEGFVKIPEEANLTHGPLSATITGKQKLRFGLPVFGCFDLLSKSSREFTVTVRPSAVDSSVITHVEPPDGTLLKAGEPVTFRWVLKRAGQVRIHVWYQATDGLAISVRPQTPPSDAVLDEQRPAGPNTFTFALASQQGATLPVGVYRFEIELLDPPNSGFIPAKAKDGSFTVVFGR